MSFGKNLKIMRKKRGLTQKELADLVGIKRSTVAGYESKNQEPSYEILKKISDTLQCSIDTLLDFNEKNAVKEKAVLKKITANKELEELIDNLKEMDSKDINFYRKLIEFIETEKN